LVDEGLLAAEKADVLASRAAREGRSPIRLLFDDGVLDQATLDRADLDDEVTLIPGQTVRRAEVDRDALPERIGRYRVVRLLGRGGMGRVYAAFDPNLERKVALKLLADTSAERRARFLREARAQAMVDHPHVCKVYEVGEEGVPYIAMQLIEGRPLLEAAETMCLQQKLVTVMQVARGLHHAHRAGLIHRDLKPANIMVDTLGSPHVLDFGLARSSHDQDLTLAGQIMGTPGYMAPEQARGEIDSLDRRTDVYGLGATLYAVLTGRAPFEHVSQAEILAAVTSRDPLPVRRIRPEVPRDVETIAMKCLAKEPERRYATARALADDLDRFLEGDPIAARPAGWLYKTSKWTRKHRVPMSIAAVALVVLMAALTWSGRQSAIRARLARDLTADLKEIEAATRLMHLSRRHDIRPDLADLRRRMVAIESTMESAGAPARGPGSYALGYAHLMLGEHEAARLELARALAEGYDREATTYALGLVHADLYRAGLPLLDAITDSDRRAAERDRLERQHRDPAARYMAEARSYDRAPAGYLEGLIGFLAEDYGTALAALEEPIATLPWFHEARRLKADIYGAWAWAHHEAGEPEAARDHFDAALAAYDRAIEVAESDPANYLAKARALTRVLYAERFSAADVRGYAEMGLRALAAAAAIQPDLPGPALQEARIHRALALRLRLEGGDAESHLELAAEAAERARLSGADASSVGMELGSIYHNLARAQMEQKRDPGDLLDRAIEALEQVEDDRRDFVFHYQLASTYRLLAKTRAGRGEAAGPPLENAVALSRWAMAIRPDRIENHNLLAASLLDQARLDMAAGPPARLLREEAVAVLADAVRRRPDSLGLRYQHGRALVILALGGDAYRGQLDPFLMACALDAYRAGLDLNPRFGHLYNVMGRVHLFLANDAWDQGGDPDPHLTRALAVYALGREEIPDSWQLMLNTALAHYYRGKYRVRQGIDPAEDLVRAAELAREVLSRVPSDQAGICLGSALRIDAEYRLVAGGDPRPLLDEAASVFEALLERDPELTEGYRSLGRLETLRGRMLARVGQDPGAVFASAADHLARASALEPDNVLVLLARARLSLVRLIHAPVVSRRSLIERGLEDVARVLAQRPGHGEAIALQTCLRTRCERRQAEVDGAVVRTLFETYPNLRFEWGPLLVETGGL